MSEILTFMIVRAFAKFLNSIATTQVREQELSTLTLHSDNDLGDCQSIPHVKLLHML